MLAAHTGRQARLGKLSERYDNGATDILLRIKSRRLFKTDQSQEVAKRQLR